MYSKPYFGKTTQFTWPNFIMTGCSPKSNLRENNSVAYEAFWSCFCHFEIITILSSLFNKILKSIFPFFWVKASSATLVCNEF